MRNSVNSFIVESPTTSMQKFIRFPLIRIIIVAIFLAVPIMAHNMLVDYVLSRISKPLYTYIIDIETVLVFLALIWAYKFYVRLIEKREAFEFSLKGCGNEFAIGAVISAVMIAFMIILMASLGYYRIDSFASSDIIFHSFFSFSMGAFIQELVFALIIFRNVEDLLGTWGGVIVICLVFSILHAGNPNTSIGSSIALGLSEILLVGAFILTRRIWLVLGLHASWNYLQDGIFGMPNSGVTELKSWINPQVTGPEWLTGGNFGIEKSYIIAIVTPLIGLIFLYMAVKGGQIVLPVWKRKQKTITE